MEDSIEEVLREVQHDPIPPQRAQCDSEGVCTRPPAVANEYPHPVPSPQPKIAEHPPSSPSDSVPATPCPWNLTSDQWAVVRQHLVLAAVFFMFDLLGVADMVRRIPYVLVLESHFAKAPAAVAALLFSTTYFFVLSASSS